MGADKNLSPEKTLPPIAAVKTKKKANAAWVKVKADDYLRLRRIERAAERAVDVLDEIDLDVAQETAAEIRRAADGYLSPWVQ